MGNIFDLILIHPFINALIAIYLPLHNLGIPFSLGLAIIIFTIIARILLYPLTKSQLEATAKMQMIQPHMKRIQEKHKGDSVKLQQEMMLLYKEHGVNPAAGCLPLLLQIPIFFALYNSLSKVVTANTKSINDILYFPAMHLKEALDLDFFGSSLAWAPNQWQKEGWMLLLIPIITILLQFVQTKMMQPSLSISEEEKKFKGKKLVSDSEKFQKDLQNQMMYLMPLFIGYAAYNFPIGLALYWNTFTLFGILQQYRLQGLGGLEGTIKKIWKNKK